VNIVVDTSVLIDHLRGDARALNLLLEVVRSGEDLWSVSVVRTEILVGVRDGEEHATERLLDQLHWLDVDQELADAAGRLGRRYLRSHPGVDTVDYLIAAAVEKLGARLLTMNVRHFPMIPGLTPAYG
jgi:predicted nucleic acid-binding protein